MEDSFPVIEFANFDKHPEQTARELFDAASRWGFLILKGHGILQEDVNHIFDLVSHTFQSKYTLCANFVSQKTSSISLKPSRKRSR